MAITKKYDSVFEKFRGKIPLAFMRSLAYTQSKMNASKSVQNSGGLFMISKPAMEAFDKKYPGFMPPSPHKVTDLADPAFNTAIAAWIINNITTYYANKYPKTMSVNWNSPDYASIIAHSFNVGYAEPKGLGAAIKIVNDKDPNKMNLDSLAAVSKEIGLGKRKYAPKAITRAKTVANLYVADLGGKIPQSPIPGQPELVPEAKGGGAMIAVLLAIPAIAFFAFKKK